MVPGLSRRELEKLIDESRTFRIVFVGENHGGGGLTENADKTIEYSGKKIILTQ